MDAPGADAGAGGRDARNSVVDRLGELATQAAATALLWRQLDQAQRALARERAEALRLRAQIGEEMYKLWRARALPPSTLDDLFGAIDRAMAEIDVQRQRVEALRAQFTGGTAPPPDPVLILDADPAHPGITVQPAPPPVPAAPTRRLATAGSDATPCPTCGELGPANKAFCGYCGARLR